VFSTYVEEDAYKNKDDLYWQNMIKEADSNGDGEVQVICNSRSTTTSS
jgi:hypothetical protein